MFAATNVDVNVIETKMDGCEVGCSTSTSGLIDESSHVAAGITRVDKVFNHDAKVVLALADVVIPHEEVETVSSRFNNSLYGYFVGQRPAFPVVQNFVRNVWKKFGFMHVMIHQGFFMFQFSSREGMENVLNHGSWRIRSIPLILHIWNPNSVLIKHEINKVHVWVKMYNVPVVAYSKVLGI